MFYSVTEIQFLTIEHAVDGPGDDAGHRVEGRVHRRPHGAHGGGQPGQPCACPANLGGCAWCSRRARSAATWAPVGGGSSCWSNHSLIVSKRCPRVARPSPMTSSSLRWLGASARAAVVARRSSGAAPHGSGSDARGGGAAQDGLRAAGSRLSGGHGRHLWPRLHRGARSGIDKLSTAMGWRADQWLHERLHSEPWALARAAPDFSGTAPDLHLSPVGLTGFEPATP